MANARAGNHEQIARKGRSNTYASSAVSVSHYLRKCHLCDIVTTNYGFPAPGGIESIGGYKGSRVTGIEIDYKPVELSKPGLIDGTVYQEIHEIVTTARPLETAPVEKLIEYAKSNGLPLEPLRKYCREQSLKIGDRGWFSEYILWQEHLKEMEESGESQKGSQASGPVGR